jgi:hypothetical protein
MEGEWGTLNFATCEDLDTHSKLRHITVEATSIFFLTGSTAPLGPGLWVFSFKIILQMVGLLGLVISSSQGLYLNTGQHKHRINKYQTSTPGVGFEPTVTHVMRVSYVTLSQNLPMDLKMKLCKGISDISSLQE